MFLLFLKQYDASCEDNTHTPKYRSPRGIASPRSISSFSMRSQQSLSMMTVFVQDKLHIVPGSIFSSVLLLAGGIIGGSVLTVAYAISIVGCVMGFIYLVILSIMGIYSTYSLIYCLSSLRCISYREIANTLFGRSSATLIQTLLLFYFCFAIMGYTCAVKNMFFFAIYKIFGYKIDKILLIVSAYIIILPLCLKRKMSASRYAFFYGFASMALLIFSLVYEFIYGAITTKIHMDEIVVLFTGNLLDHSYTISIFLNGLQDQSFVLPIYWELQHKTPRKMVKVVIYAFLSCCVVYILCGYTGYFLFGSGVAQNLASSDGFIESKLLFTSSLAIGLYLLYCIPTTTMTLRKYICELIQHINNYDSSHLDDSVRFEFGKFMHYIVSFGILIFGGISGYLINNLGESSSLMGSTMTPITSFVFPTLCILTSPFASFKMKVYNGLIMVIVVINSIIQLYRQIKQWTD